MDSFFKNRTFPPYGKRFEKVTKMPPKRIQNGGPKPSKKVVGKMFDFWIDFGSQNGSKWTPGSGQDGCLFPSSTDLGSSWASRGPILCRCWALLAQSISDSFSHRFLKHFLLWKWSQNEPKSEPKLSLISLPFSVTFLIDFWSILGG